MSDVVERLAKRREAGPALTMSKFASVEELQRAAARWWMEAVADEIEGGRRSDLFARHAAAYVATWLRTQASTDSDTSGVNSGHTGGEG